MATPEDLGDEEFGELDGLEQLDELDESDEGLDELDDAKDEGEDDNGDDGEDSGVEAPLEDEEAGAEEEEESLDVILAREQDLEEEFARVGEGSARQPTTTVPPGEDEFTCRSCFLVKRQAQLADADELFCTDCA